MPQKFILLVAILCTKLCFSQTPEELLEKTRLNYTPEKIYIHFDKQSYIAGDTIWFKAYIMDGFLPSKLSTVLNVELLDAKNNIAYRKLLPINAGAAIGNISLDSALTQGAYNIVAYTKVMMNFGTTNFYSKLLNIYNAKNLNASSPIDLVPEIKFLPEAGNFVAGLENVVAFKCADINGNPLPITGKIKTSKGVEVASFSAQHDGMGKFKLTPVSGETYFAECNIKSIVKNIILPTADEGITQLKLNYSKNKALLEINNEKVVADEARATSVIGTIENNVAFKLAINTEKAVTKAELPISTFPSGILKITSFNSNNKPLAERLFFVNSDDYKVEAKMQIKNTSISPRSKSTFAFSLNDTTSGNYSISVTDADAEIESTEGIDNIISRFLLTDNLTGKIYNPAYYFEVIDEQHNQHLDLVMLTNGWRRYNWNEVLSNKFPSMAFKDPNYITLKGVVKKIYSTQLLPNTELVVMVKTRDTIPDIFDVTTDKNAAFTLPGLIFEDTAYFSFQNTTGKDKRLNMQLSANNLAEEFKVTKSMFAPPALVWPNENQKNQIKRLNTDRKRYLRNVKELETIMLLSKAKTASDKFKERYVSKRFSGSGSRSEDLLENPPPLGIRIFEYIQSRFSSVQVQGGPLNYQLIYRNTRSLSGGYIPMTVYLDEIEVEPNTIATMMAQDIALINVLPNGAITGSGGALVLYTNRERRLRESNESNFSTAELVGFSPTKEFYSPDYSVQFVNNSVKEDVRSTLYWNPYIVLENGKKEINLSFYNSDNAKRFKIVLEGVNQNGGILHFEKILE
jgi:hypothetical protein